jgi:sugar phosphate isomerase/epimerase
MDLNTSARTATRKRWWLLAVAVAAGAVTIPLIPAGAVAAVDECVYGYTASASVFFGTGSAASGVANYDTGNGCTIMDEVMAGAPFANHGTFLSTVNRVTSELRREGVLTGAETSDIVGAAAASLVGKPVQETGTRSVDLSRVGLVSGTAGTIDGATLTSNPAVNLAGLANCGFQNIEFSGAVGRYHGSNAETLAALAGSVGIDVPSIGISLNDLKTNLAGVISDAQTYGAKYVRFSPGGDWTLEDFSREAAFLNEVGAQLAPYGIKVGVHNHQNEFETDENGVTGYDVLLRETDPEFVTMEIDIGWSVSAGADTVELFQTYPGRFELLHFRDLTDLNVPGVFSPVGEGAMDLAEVFANYSLGGVEYGHTEHNAACQGLANLAELKY